MVLLVWAEQAQREDLAHRGINCLLQFQKIHNCHLSVAFNIARAVHRWPHLAPVAQDATTLFEFVLTIDPNHVKSLYALGDIAQRSGDMELAKSFYQRYVDALELQANEHPLGKFNIRFFNDIVAYAMGHLAFLPEAAIKEERIGWRPKRSMVLLAPKWDVANQALVDEWKKHFCVIQDEQQIRQLKPLAENLMIDAAFSRMPDGRVSHIRLAIPFVQQEYEKQRFDPVLKLSEAIRERGWPVLEKLGIAKGQKFITLHVRESGFKNEKGQPHNANRDDDVSTYLETVEMLVSRGYRVIRMGEPSMKVIPSMAGVFDYAHSDLKADWLDLFLCAEAFFYIGSSGGLFATPQVYGTPIVSTNYPLTFPGHSSQDIFIPKLLKRVKTDEFLTFNELLAPPFWQFEEGGQFSRLGVDWQINSSQEILEVVTEMLDLREGKLNYTQDEQILQDRFRALYAKQDGLCICRIGRDFLAKNQHLLV
jgi:putative glycosyltransferase (TIGR04372 family)